MVRRVVGVLVVLVGVWLGWTGFAWWHGADGSPATYPYALPNGVRVDRHVPQQRVSPSNATFALDVHRLGEPVVLVGSLVTQWTAMQRWTPEYLQAHIEHLEGVYLHSKPTFGPYFEASNPLGDLSQVKPVNAYAVTNMSSAQFWPLAVRSRSSQPRSWVYFTNNWNRIWYHSSPRIRRDIQPSQALELDPSSSKVNANLWLGQAGSRAHLHFDSHANFVVQVFGRKKWILFPPHAEAWLYMYPFLHPSNAQSQVQVDADAAEWQQKWPLLQGAGAWEVTLEPGQVLYVPPFWWHATETLETSASVNWWSEWDHAHDVEAMIQLLRNSPLFASVTTHVQRCALVVELVRSWLQSAAPHVHAQPWCASLWKRRFATLVADGHLPGSTASKGTRFIASLCRNELRRDSALSRAMRAVLVTGDVHVWERLHELDEDDDWPELVPATENASHQEVASLIPRMAALLARLPATVRPLWIGNVIEIMATMAVPLEAVPTFIETCLGGQ